MTDLNTVLSHLRHDPVLAALIERFPPPSWRTATDPAGLFASLVDAIVSQQISGKAADAILRRLQASMSNGAISPEGILAVGVEGLRAGGASNAKARYLVDLAERVVDGELALGRLPELDDEAVIEHLTRVKGVGRWTAQMVLIFALARPDVLPVADLGFRTALLRQYGLEKLPRPDEIERLAEPWRPYRSYGTWYMWRSLR